MPDRSNRNKTTVLLLGAVILGMVGLSFASVPLYRLFCQVTGFGGTTQRAEAAPSKTVDRRMTILFDANTAGNITYRLDGRVSSNVRSLTVYTTLASSTIPCRSTSRTSNGFPPRGATRNVSPQCPTITSAGALVRE